MGRVWPRLGHRGPPLNSVVSHHLSTVDFEAILQAIEVGVVFIVFFACVFGGVKPKFRPVDALWVGLALIGPGALFHIGRSVLGGREWVGFGPWFIMQRGTIWHGTTFLAIAYGLLAYSAFRGVGSLRKGDG